MKLKDYIDINWKILKPADDYSMDIYALNIAETLIKDLQMQDYNDLIEMIKIKRRNLLEMEIQ